jgi:hypothetical protein
MNTEIEIEKKNIENKKAVKKALPKIKLLKNSQGLVDITGGAGHIHVSGQYCTGAVCD